jgi:hypothetical protein
MPAEVEAAGAGAVTAAVATTGLDGEAAAAGAALASPPAFFFFLFFLLPGISRLRPQGNKEREWTAGKKRGERAACQQLAWTTRVRKGRSASCNQRALASTLLVLSRRTSGGRYLSMLWVCDVKVGDWFGGSNFELVANSIRRRRVARLLSINHPLDPSLTLAMPCTLLMLACPLQMASNKDWTPEELSGKLNELRAVEGGAKPATAAPAPAAAAKPTPAAAAAAPQKLHPAWVVAKPFALGGMWIDCVLFSV